MATKQRAAPNKPAKKPAHKPVDRAPSTWSAQVWAAVQRVPRGRVAAYGDIAAFLGSPLKARQVGTALSVLPEHLTDAVPWHRIVNAKGYLSIRGTFMGKERQQARLRAEGVHVDDTYTVVDFARLRLSLPAPRVRTAKPAKPVTQAAAARSAPSVRRR